MAIIGRNRPQLYWAMVAAQACGAVPVPLYQDAVAEEMAFVLEHCGARFVVAGDQEQVDKVLEVSGRLPALEADRLPRPARPAELRPRPAARLRRRAGAGTRRRRRGRARRSRRASPAQGADDTCVMLYTSGTTGRPKGVVLSNRNIIATAQASAGFDRLTAADSVLAYLPMAWVGDFIFSMGQAYWAGFCVACPESAATMQHDLREIGPTYFFAPPRFFEGLLTNVMIRMEDAGRAQAGAVPPLHGARPPGRPGDPRRRARSAPATAPRYALGELLVYGPLRNALGLSRIRVGYTAGEAIGPEIFAFYRALGINLKQLYGQTEASVFITQQPDGEVRADTVGVASPGVELRIAESGEVFYRSPGVFVEYFRSPESTAATKDAEGWVATGDAGFIEPGTGHLRIIDRAKDVGRMADGSLFAPKYVENKLKFYPNILEAVVFGAAGRWRPPSSTST